MSKRGVYHISIIALLAIALAARIVPLYWSPLPSTLDGFVYAAHARDTIVAGSIPIAPDVRADRFVLSTLVTIASYITDVRPVHAIQPVVSMVGTATMLAGGAIAVRTGREYFDNLTQVRVAAIATMGLLAVQGLFLRRTTVAHPEVLGLLLGLVAVIALHRVLDPGNPSYRWAAVLGVLLLLFPILHIFSSFMAGMALIALVAAESTRRGSLRVLVLGTGIVLLYLTVSFGYYDLVDRLGFLFVAYVERISTRTGLFVAWVIAMIVGVAWFQSTSERVMQGVFLLPIALWLLIAAINSVTPVFPGTIASPPIIVALLLPLAMPVAFAVLGVPALRARHRHATVVLSLLAAPVVVSYFSLTADLTPEYFATVMRAQTFAHVPVFVLVGLACGAVIGGRTFGIGRIPVRAGLLFILVLSVLATTPIAFLTLDTGHFPATTSTSEFHATEFATTHVDGAWTSDQPASRIARQYFGSGTGGLGPTRDWLAGGSEPNCAVLSLESWSTHGAHFWPAQPRLIAPTVYKSFLAERHLVYASSGRDPLSLSLPADTRQSGC